MRGRGQDLTDTQLLLELIGEAYSFESLAEFRSGVLEVLNRVVPSDLVAYNEIADGEAFALMIPGYDESLMPTFAALSHENPLISRIRATGDGRPRRISDFLDREAFHGTALYQQFYRLIGVESQVAFSLPSPPQLIVGLALTRTSEDFSDREVQLLALARPHLMQAYRNAELRSARAATLAALEQGLDVLGRHVVVIDRHGRVEFATDGARRLLDSPTPAGSPLPEEILGRLPPKTCPRSAAQPLVLKRPHGEVLLRLLPSGDEDHHKVLLLEGAPGQLSAAALRGLGLTAREAEVLRCLALGHSPVRTAARLGVARRTLDKHLQHVYDKLGVRSLEDATTTAWAAVGVEPGAEATPPE